MNVRSFNSAGLEQMRTFICSVGRPAPLEYPTGLLTDDRFSTVIVPNVAVEPRSFRSRYELAEYLVSRFDGAKGHDFEHDRGMWAWLALFYFNTLIGPAKGGARKPGALARWIPETNYNRYYRHLVAGPWRIYRAHRERPKIALGLLCTAPHTMGDIVEQIAARQELVTNRAVVGTVTALYVDANGNLKRGAGGKGRGSPRRLADVLAQYDLTYDLYSMEPEELLDLLPEEFSRFKKAS